MKKLAQTGILVGALAIAGVGASVATAKRDEPPTAAYLAPIPLGVDSGGRQWNLGGFSGLAPIGSSGKKYWTLTDRGPNDDADRKLADDSGAYCATKPSGKVIFMPEFTPEIDKLRVKAGAIEVRKRIQLHDGANKASGKPNLTFDENTYLQTDAVNKTCAKLPDTNGVIDPFGVDTEGIVVDPRDGSFWLADEYRPSILRVARDGQILSRIVPEDLTSPSIPTATNYAAALAAAGGTFAVQPKFPAIVNAFRKNRGFEGLALSPDGKSLYTVVQSPLDFQALGVSNANRNLARNSPYIRVFKLDISKPTKPVLKAQWIYLLSRGFSSAVPDKISDVQWAGDDTLLIQERDDERPTAITNYYKADFTAATNLLAPGAAADLAAKTTVPTLEMTNPVPAFITPATSSLAVDVDQLLTAGGFLNSKIEGSALMKNWGREGLLAVLNDNDFDLDHTALPGLFPTSVPTQLDRFR
ncbi:MAG TPA: esterase-like activity of phytase family protein [Baekduia sp.]|nr:esterase-like activity of phytase family protein [Baekduia sp.]